LTQTAALESTVTELARPDGGVTMTEA